MALFKNIFGNVPCPTLGEKLSTPLSPEEFLRAKERVAELEYDLDTIQDQVFLTATTDAKRKELVKGQLTLTKWLNRLNKLEKLNPRVTSKVSDYLARWFNYQVGLAGSIKYTADRVNISVRSMIETTGRIVSIKRVEELRSTIKALPIDVTPREVEELITTSIEVGAYGRVLHANGNTTSASVFAKFRQDKYIERLRNLGLDDAEIEHIFDLAVDVGTAYQEAATIARGMGTEINTLQNLGYVTHVLTQMGKLRLTDITEALPLLNHERVSDMTLSTIFNNQRSTNTFAIEDLAALAEVTGIADNLLLVQGTDSVFSQAPVMGESYIRGVQKVPDMYMAPVGGNFDEIKAVSLIDGAASWLRNIDPSIEVIVGKLDNLATIMRGVDTLKIRRNLVVNDLPIDGLIIKVPNAATGMGTVTHFIPVYGTVQPFDYLGAMHPIIEHPFVLVDFLYNRLGSHATDELLLETGILTKVPMTAVEFWDYFNTKYHFGFREPGDFIKLTFEENMTDYTNSLNHAASIGAFIQAIIVDDARRANWSVSPKDPAFIANPELFSNYIPIGNFRERLLTSGFSEGQIELLKDVKVHPRVAKQFEAISYLTTDALSLGQFAKVMSEIGLFMNKSVLLAGGKQFLLNNTLTNMIVAAGAGNNSLRTLPTIKKLYKMFMEGIDHLSDQPFFYGSLKKGGPPRWFSEKEFILEWSNRHASGYAPGVYGEVRVSKNPIRAALGTPHSFLSSIEQMFQYVTAKGESISNKHLGLGERLGRTLEVGGLSVKTLISKSFAPVAYYSNFLEMAVQLSTYMSLAYKGADIQFGQVLTSGTNKFYHSFEELDKVIAENFIRPETMGIAEKSMSRFVQPFIQYALHTPPIVLRLMMRRPGMFMTYLRAQALMQRVEQEKNDLRQAGFKEFELDGNPYVLFTDPKTGKIGMLMPNGFNSIDSTITLFRDTGEAFMRVALGVPIGSPESIRSEYDPKTDKMSEFFRELMNGWYPWWQAGFEYVSGKDAQTGGSFADEWQDKWYSWNGMSLPRWAIITLDKLPFLRQLDKLNPFDLWGRAPLEDANGNPYRYRDGRVMVPGNLSVFGAERRPGADRKKDDAEFLNGMGTLMSVMGMNVRVVDYNKNLQSTYTDIQRLASNLATSLNQTEKDIQNEILKGELHSPADRERRIREFKKNIFIYGYVLTERYRVLAYMTDRSKFGGSVAPKELISKLDEDNLTIAAQYGKLPAIANKEMDEVASELAKYFRKAKELEDAEPTK